MGNSKLVITLAAVAIVSILSACSTPIYSIAHDSVKPSLSMQEYSSKVPMWEKSAASGNKYAMEVLAGIYQEGWGVEKDIHKSWQYSLDAANKGNINSIVFVGDKYFSGFSDVGIKQSYVDSYAWYKKALSIYMSGVKLKEREIKSLSSGVSNMALIEYNGYVGPSDYAGSLLHNELALKLDPENYAAMTNLGQHIVAMHPSGYTREQGILMLKQAAAHGSVAAQKYIERHRLDS